MTRPWRRERRHALLACLLLLVAYFVVPVESDPNGARLAVRSLATLLLVAWVAWLVTTQVRRQLAAGGTGPAAEVPALLRLAVALVAGLLAFALADYVIARSSPGQFVDLDTRIDALYFALATLTTIGYGDVHPQGQIARAAVSAQMVFSIGVIATGVSLVVRELAPGRRPDPRPAGRPAGPPPPGAGRPGAPPR
ncbi:two pore domain potassium channel family protein [Micromonospora sp. HSS6-12]|uniref:Two pore domain potassium channel family protein n=2 Tax=Micromonospora thermarum TaxID=2720024 RepID=A0ABX0ZDI2_9ACTN|nr:two pore domain potassium channel family protein [Micromonospora thermarum]